MLNSLARLKAAASVCSTTMILLSERWITFHTEELLVNDFPDFGKMRLHFSVSNDP